MDFTQFVDGSTHQDGGVLNLVLTDVPELTAVKVGTPVGNSDHAHLAVTLSLSLCINLFLRSTS